VFRTYRRLFSQREVFRLVASNLVGRLSNGTAALAIALRVRADGATFGAVGFYTALFGIAVAVGGPLLGRWVDRKGQVMVLLISGCISGAGFALFGVFGISIRVIAPLLVVLAGFFTPPLESCLRSLWPVTLRGQDVEIAYALDASLQELIFVIGPLVVVLLNEVISPSSSLIFTAATTIAGTGIYAGSRSVRGWVPVEATRHWLGPLRVTVFVRIFASFLFVGCVIGVLDVGVVAYADAYGMPGSSGILLAVNAVGALFGGLIYGSRAWTKDTRKQLVVITCCLAGGYWLLALSPVPAAMAVLMGMAGIFLPPALACGFKVVQSEAPSGMVTESFAWLVTVFLVGISVGSAVTGKVANSGVLSEVFLLPGAFGSCALLVMLTVWPISRRDGHSAPSGEGGVRLGRGQECVIDRAVVHVNCCSVEANN
jgi:predicted MFS family arabinose efflux permease